MICIFDSLQTLKWFHSVRQKMFSVDYPSRLDNLRRTL